MSNRIALFDMDKTLVRQDTAGLFIRYEYEIGRASAWQVARVFSWRLQYALGRLAADAVAERALSWYRGRDVQQLRIETQAWAEQRVFPLISPQARAAVARHQQAGDLVVIATAQVAFGAEPLMRELGVQELVSSELEVVDGKLSGRLIPPLCFGAGKLQRIREFLERRTGSADLSQATAYTDSITDLPMLEAVAEPVVINPDIRLARLARLRGWRVEHW